MKNPFRGASSKPRARWLAAGLASAVLLFIAERLIWPSRTVVTVAPGLTLTTVETNTARGALKYYLLTAQPSAGWHLAVKSAGPPENQRDTVLNQTQAAGATVGVNGSYFFYNGPAVGPLKLNEKWHLLPWSDRTSLGLDAAGQPHIAPVTVKATLTVGQETLPIACLNGDPDNQAKPDALTLLTPDYGPAYEPGPDESVAILSDDKVQSVLPANPPGPMHIPVTASSTIGIPPGGYLLIGRGQAQGLVKWLHPGDPARLGTLTSPASWSNFPTILGGGPCLIKDGQIDDTEVAEQFKPDVRAPGPRTTFGIDENGDLLILVVDGWSVRHPGLTLPETAALLQSYGARDAMNFDGGSSTTLVVNGQIVDDPNGPDGGTQVSNLLLLIPGAADTGPQKTGGPIAGSSGGNSATPTATS